MYSPDFVDKITILYAKLSDIGEEGEVTDTDIEELDRIILDVIVEVQRIDSILHLLQRSDLDLLERSKTFLEEDTERMGPIPELEALSDILKNYVLILDSKQRANNERKPITEIHVIDED
jgi:hypothetical protein